MHSQCERQKQCCQLEKQICNLYFCQTFFLFFGAHKEKNTVSNAFDFIVLLCRGKAVKDFSGPDCRFLSFKTSETIYVYYKLSGKRADLWAGSVSIPWLLFNAYWKNITLVYCYILQHIFFLYLSIGWK